MAVVENNYVTNKKTRRRLRPGDLIEFPRGIFSHWGVYLGNGDVAHFTSEDGLEQKTNNAFAASGPILVGPGTIRIENFWKIVGEGTAKKNNSGDNEHRPFDRKTIVENAKKKLGKHEYDVVKFNCEHFVKWCRYGFVESDQDPRNLCNHTTAIMENNYVTNMKTLRSLCPGDLIEFPQDIFSHWGVYLGNEYVAHFTSEDGLEQKTNSPFAASGSMLIGPGRISIENFWKVVGKGTAKKNNSGDNEHRPLDPQTIVENAKKKLGKHMYHVAKFNCEHFVKWCRYGLEESDQDPRNLCNHTTAIMENNYVTNMKTLRSLCPGDLIEFPRDIFSHWGVYLGNEYVAHFTSEDGLEQKTNSPFAASGSMLIGPGRISIENFWKVVGKGTAKKNNSGDNEHRPLDPQTIVENAKKKLGKHMYHVAKFNCEHFVKWCRYGLEESDQDPRNLCNHTTAIMENNYVTNMKTLRSLCPGDLIEFPRDIFSHWGVYLGNEDVAHFAFEDGLEQMTNNPFAASGSMLVSHGRIRIENFWQVVGKGTAKKNNSGDNEHRPLDPQTIVEKAKMKLGKYMYDVNFNCEHFVIWCRYGLVDPRNLCNHTMAVMENIYVTNKKTLKSLCTGDLIEFPRGIFSHWGVYLGNGDVAHFTSEDDLEQKTNVRFAASGPILVGPGRICIENFWKVVGEGTAKKNNSGDNEHRPLDPQTIVENAKKKLGKHMYHAAQFNCEHFVKWCRYGLEESDQVKKFVGGATVVVTAGLLAGPAGLLVGAAALVWGLLKNNKENNK